MAGQRTPAPYLREAIERIIELRLGERLPLETVGERLEAEGVPTPRGGRWWPATVRHALLLAEQAGDARARAALDLKLHRQRHGYRGTRSVESELAARISTLSEIERVPQHEIAEILADEGVATARGGRWRQSTVQSVLSTSSPAGQLQPDGEGSRPGP